MLLVLEVPRKSEVPRNQLLGQPSTVSGEKITRAPEVCPVSRMIEDAVQGNGVFLEDVALKNEKMAETTAPSEEPSNINLLEDCKSSAVGESVHESSAPVESERRIRIEKSKKVRILGLQVGMLKMCKFGGLSSGGLKIEKLDQGLVHQWNLSNPSTQVHEKDIIVEVNAVRGRSGELFRKMINDRVLELCLLRPGDCETQADGGIPGWCSPLRV